MMKNLFFLMLALVWTPLMSHASVLNFADQSSFDAQFPSSTRYTAGSNSTISLAASSTVQLYSQGDSSMAGRATIYSAADNTNYNFISGSKTISFSNISVSYLTSVGATYYAYVGIFSQNTGAVTSANDGIYFSIHGNGNDLSLIQRTDGANSTLYTWTLTSSQFYPTVSLTTLSLTLNGTTWGVSGSLGDGTNLTASGSLTNTITAGNWGSNFYIGLESDQTSNNAPTRYTTLTAGTITAIPEPPTVSLILGSCVLLLLCMRLYTTSNNSLTSK